MGRKRKNKKNRKQSEDSEGPSSPTSGSEDMTASFQAADTSPASEAPPESVVQVAAEEIQVPVVEEKKETPVETKTEAETVAEQPNMEEEKVEAIEEEKETPTESEAEEKESSAEVEAEVKEEEKETPVDIEMQEQPLSTEEESDPVPVEGEEEEEEKEAGEETDKIVLCINPDEGDAPEFSACPVSPTRDPQLSGYAPDCGTKEYKFLSMAKVRRERGLTHPMHFSETEVDETGNPIPENYPVIKTEFGAHSFYRLKTDSTVLNKYGIGMVLYFKYLKVMGWLFFLALIFALPSISVYIFGGKSNITDVKVAAKESPTALLGMVSIGHLGEGESICTQIKYGETLDLSCEYGEIGFIKASYSAYDDQGSCSCPSAQRVDKITGQCSGHSDTQCGFNGCQEQCDRNGPGCFLGVDPVEKKPCCAHQWGRNGPDFSDLQIRSQPNCHSPTIEPILKGLCLGKTECTLQLRSSNRFRWEPTDEYDNGCFNNGMEDECEAGIDDNSNYNACPNARNRGLIVYARCFTTKVNFTSSWSLKIIGWDSITRQDFLTLAVFCDILTCISFLLLVRWMKKKEREEAKKVSSDEIMARDYTVQLMHLPQHTDVSALHADLKTHLETVLSDKPHVFKQLDRVKIADINFGLTNAVQISAMRMRGKVARKLDIASQKVAKFKALQGKLKPETFEKRLGKMLQATRALDEHLAKYDQWLDEYEKENSKGKLRAVTAFITFEEEEGYLRCLHEYPDLGPMHRLFQPYHKRFKKKRMTIRPAPDPTDIIWENLDYTYMNRAFRQFVVNLITISLLLISFALIYVTKLKKVEVENEFGRPATCPSQVTTEMVLEDEKQKANKAEYQVLVECFCKNALATGSFSDMLKTPFFDAETRSTRFYCAEWAEAFISVQALTIGAVLVVIAINAVLKQVLGKLVLREKHHTLSEQVISVVKKIFLAQFINTAVLLVLINANLDYFKDPTVPGQTDQSGLLFSGKYSDFDVSWYQDVGIALMLTMIINVFAPHGAIFLTYLKLELKRCMDRSCSCDPTITKQSTQRDLEALYRGPKFELATRYAQSLTTIFIAFLFSSGMPLLLVWGAAGIVVTYWTDKFTFLRVVRTPPGYDEKIARATGSLLPYAVLLHCLFGMWMYSNQNIFQMDYYDNFVNHENFNDPNQDNFVDRQFNDQSPPPQGETTSDIPDYWASRPGEIFERLTQPPVVLMFAFTTAMVAIAFFRYVILRYLGSFLQSLCPICVRWFTTQKPAEDYPNYFDTIPALTLREQLASQHCKESLRGPYSTALKNRIASLDSVLKKEGKHDGKYMIGCHSYDILDNKEYIDAFAINSKCATKRRLTKV